MNHVYFSSTLMWNADLPEILDAAGTYGADGIELWAQQFESRKFSAAECLRLLEKHPLPILVHSKTWDLNFASLNRSIRDASLNEIKSSIDLAARLHAAEITVHPPRESVKGSRALSRELCYHGLCEVLSYARRAGVTVSLEIMEKIPKEMMTTRQAVQELTGDLYGEFFYTVDAAHCADEPELLDFLRNLPRISKLHISNRRGKTYHTPLSDGDLSFPRLWPALETAGLPMVVEGLDLSTRYTVLQENMKYIETLKEYLQ